MKINNMNNPFLQDGESTHQYKNKTFIVDYYDGIWQCSDSSHIVRTRAKTKIEAIEQAHIRWDDYNKKNGGHS